MNGSYPVLSSRLYSPHIRSQCGSCSASLEFPVPSSIPPQGTLLRIRCVQCQTVYQHGFYSVQLPPGASASSTSQTPSGSQSTPTPSRKGRKIGTQEKPLETGYYDLLGVPIDATIEDIKKAYRQSSLPTFSTTPYAILTPCSHLRTTGHQASPRQESRRSACRGAFQRDCRCLSDTFGSSAS